jgi:hypothetical protein
MNTEFIKLKHEVFTYQLKEGTKSSYLLIEGKKNLFTERLSFLPYKGKTGIRTAKYQIDGYYKKNDLGLYKALNSGKIHTKIMKADDFPMFVGWGEIDERKNVYDLIIIYSTNNCKESFEVHLFKGLAKIEFHSEVFSYLQSFINNRSTFNSFNEVA